MRQLPSVVTINCEWGTSCQLLHNGDETLENTGSVAVYKVEMSTPTEETKLLGSPVAAAVDPLLPNDGDHSTLVGQAGFRIPIQSRTGSCFNRSKPERSVNDENEELDESCNRSEKKDVEYDSDSHMNVLFKLYGSVWPSVFPWCLVTILWSIAVISLKKANYIDLTIDSPSGHNMMSILVSFLLVTRVGITYSRFMEARQELEHMLRAARELIQHTCLLTLNDQGPRARQWRQDVAYRTIVTLRMAIAALEFRSHGVHVWECLPEKDHENTELMISSHNDPPNRATANNSESSKYRPITDHGDILKDLAHGERKLVDENFRAPVVWAFNLRQKILECRREEILQERYLHPNEELKLLAFTSEFMAAFHDVKKLIVTQQPFPIVQLCQTFLFMWIFSLPMVLISDSDQSVEVLLIVFFSTFGYLGVEYTCIELDDPYGLDANDFPTQRWLKSTFEDIYITVYKSDGRESAMSLRSRITNRIASGSALDNFQLDVSSQRFWTNLT